MRPNRASYRSADFLSYDDGRLNWGPSAGSRSNLCSVVGTDDHFHPPIQLAAARIAVAGDGIGFSVTLGTYP